MIDEELIENKIDIILKNLKYLDEVKGLEKEVFLSSFERKQAVKHSLQEAVEASLDISNHLISSEGWERAETYSEMFTRLYENEVIGSDLKDRLQNMAGFRNLLVHRYGDIDDERVWRILSERLNDISRFVEKIEELLRGRA